MREWVDKKFNLKSKSQLRQNLFLGDWSYELVIHNVRHPEELEYLKAAGIKIHQLKDIVNEMAKNNTVIKSAAGASLVDLVLLETDGE